MSGEGKNAEIPKKATRDAYVEREDDGERTKKELVEDEMRTMSEKHEKKETKLRALKRTLLELNKDQEEAFKEALTDEYLQYRPKYKEGSQKETFEEFLERVGEAYFDEQTEDSSVREEIKNGTFSKRGFLKKALELIVLLTPKGENRENIQQLIGVLTQMKIKPEDQVEQEMTVDDDYLASLARKQSFEKLTEALRKLEDAIERSQAEDAINNIYRKTLDQLDEKQRQELEKTKDKLSAEEGKKLLYEHYKIRHAIEEERDEKVAKAMGETYTPKPPRSFEKWSNIDLEFLKAVIGEEKNGR